MENDFIALISNNSDIKSKRYAVRKWRDSENEKVYPVILVHISDVRPVPESVNNAPIYSAIVEIAAKTYTADDRSRTLVFSILKYIRQTCFASNLKALLTAENNYKYLDFDVEGGVYEGDIDNKNTLSLTGTVYF